MILKSIHLGLIQLCHLFCYCSVHYLVRITFTSNFWTPVRLTALLSFHSKSLVGEGTCELCHVPIQQFVEWQTKTYPLKALSAPKVHDSCVNQHCSIVLFDGWNVIADSFLSKLFAHFGIEVLFAMLCVGGETVNLKLGL